MINKMKILTNLYFYLFLISSFLWSCTTNVPQVTPEWTETPLLTTSIPLTNTKTPLPTPPITITPLVTLSVEEAKESLRLLLEEPSNCLAPCFLGITPNETSLEEAKNIFTKFQISLDYVSTRNTFDFYSARYDFNTGLLIGIDFVIQNEIVQSLTFGVSHDEQINDLQNQLSTYNPKTLITQYGVPSSITFDVDTGPSPGYGIAMFFDAADLIVYYGSNTFRPDLKICPSIDQVGFVSMWFGENPYYPPSNDRTRVPLEEATSITKQEFVALMTGEIENSCFALKSEVFP